MHTVRNRNLEVGYRSNSHARSALCLLSIDGNFLTQRVAVVGIGQMGLAHAAIVNSFDGVTTVGIADRDKRLVKLASKALSSVAFYDDNSELVRECQPDAVFVCTPIATHADVIREVLDVRPNLAIFVEKPLAHTYQSALDLVRKTQSLPGPFAVGFQKRFNGVFQKARELLRTRELGDPVVFRAHHFQRGFHGISKGWRTSAGGGGASLEWGVHLIDLLLWFFGLPSEVVSVSRSIATGSVDDYVTSQWRYGSQVTGTVEYGWSMSGYIPSEMKLEVQCTDGYLIVTEDALVKISDRRGETTRGAVETFYRHDLTASPSILLGPPELTLQDAAFLRGGATPTGSNCCDFSGGAMVNQMIERILNQTALLANQIP